MAVDIIERIQRLMKLSDDASSPIEAAMAAERMQKLLQDHNLTRAEVEARTGEEGVKVDGVELDDQSKREKLKTDRGAMFKWQRDLMESVAGNNFCMHFVGRTFRPEPRWGGHERYVRTTPCALCDKDVERVSNKTNDWGMAVESSGYSHFVQEDWVPCVAKWEHVRGVWAKGHVLVGRSENVAATLMMFDYLTRQMRNLQPFSGRERRSADACLWMDGCAETLVERLDRKRSEAEVKDAARKAQTPGVVRLIDVFASEDDLNQDFQRGLAAGTTTKKRVERALEQKRIEDREKELIASGTDADDAWYLARDREVPTPEPAQTSFGSRQRSSYVAHPRRAWAAEERAHSRRNSDAYRAGRSAGKAIGLGGNLKGGDGPKRLKG